MSDLSNSLTRRDYPGLAARIILGIVFLYLGAVKAADPVSFLKMLRQFQILENPIGLNIVAAVLPWFEILCGLIFLSGWKLKGTAVLMLAMLLGFTAAVVWRALGVYSAESIAFCSIRFDCGCGSGVVRICTKLIENSTLLILAGVVLGDKSPKLCFLSR